MKKLISSILIFTLFITTLPLDALAQAKNEAKALKDSISYPKTTKSTVINPIINSKNIKNSGYMIKSGGIL